FIGVKLVLLASHKTISTSIPEIPSAVSLVVIVVVLAASVGLSLARPLDPGPETGSETVPAADTPDREL
ncbi:MAG: TerC family protein, partial [Streptosporangiaceae bacterium]